MQYGSNAVLSVLFLLYIRNIVQKGRQRKKAVAFQILVC